jgi:hypothetical protein
VSRWPSAPRFGTDGCRRSFAAVRKSRRHTKLIREGQYAAEVDVELVEAEKGWWPYLPLDDARKLDAVSEALRRRDTLVASRQARVYSLTPVSR